MNLHGISVHKARAGAFLCALALAGCASTPAHRPSSVEAPNPAAAFPTADATPLAARIDAYLAQPRFAHADWGVDVVSLDSGKTLYAHNADKLSVPASNAKLYIAALAMGTLGADARITTSLYATAAPDAAGTLGGDLILYGRGDPSLGDVEASSDWADRLAAALAARGVHRVHGDLIADDTFFAGSPIGSGWEANDLQSWFAPPASALSVRGNVLQVRVSRDGVRSCEVVVDPSDSGMQIANLTQNMADGGDDALGLYRAPGADTLYVYGALPSAVTTKTYVVSAPDPALLAANLLRDALSQRGIVLEGSVRAVHWPQVELAATAPGTVTLAENASPSIGDLIQHMLKHSDNLYAQDLLEQIGVKTAQRSGCVDRSQLPRSSADWGLCALRAMLVRAGIASDLATFNEGTGLSRQDLIAPEATTRLLAWIAQQPFAAVLHDALPIASVDGTLRNRMRGTPAAHNIQAKTGTLTHAYALSGYVTNASGENLVFSLMLDHYQRPADALGRNIPPSPTDDLDAIAAMLAENTR